MSLPTLNDIHNVSPVLTNMMVAYMQGEGRFIASQLFPEVPVATKSGTYYIFTKKYWFLDGMEQRAPGGNYARNGFGAETSTYDTLQWALAYPLADEIAAANQAPMALDTAAVRWLGQQNLIRKERAFATDFMKTSVWGTSDTTATDWDDFANGDPINDVITAKRTVSNNTGQEPNTMALGYIVHQALVNHPDLIDRVKYVQTATMATLESAMAAVFGVDRYIVGKASYNSANEAQTFSAAAIVDDDCLVCYVTPNPGIFEASAGYTFTWASGGGGGAVMRYYDDDTDAEIIKTKAQWDQVAVATDVGYFFSDIV